MMWIMETIKRVELVEINGIKFEVEKEYFYDNDLKEYYVDVALGNKNLQKMEDKYNRIIKSLNDNKLEEKQENIY